MSRDNSKIVIEELTLLLRYAEKAYTEYVENDKQFVFAKVLFDTNDEIRNLLKKELLSIPYDMQCDALELIFHIDIWRYIWLEEVERQKPIWSDSFAFPNKVTFPRQSVERLLSCE